MSDSSRVVQTSKLYVGKRNNAFNRVEQMLGENWFFYMVMGLAICIVLFTVIYRWSGFTSTEGIWSIAENVVNGKGYTACSADYFPFCSNTNQQTAMREPIPVYLMAASYFIWHTQSSGIVLQCILYLGTLLVIFAFLNEKDKRVARFGALLWTISIPVLELLKTDSGALACAFFLSIGVLFFQKGRERGGIRYWLMSAAFFGLASLSRSVILVIPPALAVGLFWERRLKLLRGLNSAGPSMMFLATFFIVMMPWVIRNELVLGKPVMGSTLTGYNVLRMNYMLSNRDFVPHYVGANEFGPVLTKLIQQSSLTGKENEVQMQDYYLKIGLQTILSNPGGYLQLSAFRFLSLWFNTTVEAAYGYPPYNLEGVIEVAFQFILLIAVVAGAIINRRPYWPLCLSLVLVCAAYIAIDAQIRYLVDIMPLVVILAASLLPCIIRIYQPIQSGRKT
jgi:hypothetical protein